MDGPLVLLRDNGRRNLLATGGFRLRARSVGVLVVAIGVLRAGLTAQTPPSAPIAFEAASIKRVADGSLDPEYARFQPGGRFVAANASLSVLIRLAYSGLPRIAYDFLDMNGATRVRSERFNVAAQARGNPSAEQSKAMLKTLLADRFKLRTHVETRARALYVLVLARRDGQLGPGLRPTTCAFVSDPPSPTPIDPVAVAHCMNNFGSSRLGARRVALPAITLDTLAMVIQLQVNGTVRNRTAIPGKFDVDVEFTSAKPQVTPALDETPLTTALEEQLGLRLEPTTGPVDVIVIDHVERPTED